MSFYVYSGDSHLHDFKILKRNVSDFCCPKEIKINPSSSYFFLTLGIQKTDHQKTLVSKANISGHLNFLK